MDPFPKFEKYQGTLWKEELMPAEEAFAVAKRQGYDKESFLWMLLWCGMPERN
jgi:hypothetical protein